MFDKEEWSTSDGHDRRDYIATHPFGDESWNTGSLLRVCAWKEKDGLKMQLLQGQTSVSFTLNSSVTSEEEFRSFSLVSDPESFVELVSAMMHGPETVRDLFVEWQERKENN